MLQSLARYPAGSEVAFCKNGAILSVDNSWRSTSEKDEIVLVTFALYLISSYWKMDASLV